MRAAISRIPRSITLVLVGVLLGVASTAWAASRVWVQAPANAPDFEPVAVAEAAIVLLTDQVGQRTVQITNGTNVTLCVSVDADSVRDCVGETLTCTGGDNFTVILAGGSKAWLIGKDMELCGKTSAEPTGIITVEELVQ